MKALILPLLVTFTNVVYCQTSASVDALKKENIQLKSQVKRLSDDTTFLRAKLKYFEKLNEPKTFEIKGISNSIDIAVLSCLGDKNNQTVTVAFVITHKILHQTICIATDRNNVKAYDEIGNELPVGTADIGTNSQGDIFGDGRCNKIPTEVPVKGFATFRNVMPGTDLIKFLTVAFKYRNFDSDGDYTYGNLEIRNLRIHW
jgi:hypothetical protein